MSVEPARSCLAEAANQARRTGWIISGADGNGDGNDGDRPGTPAAGVGAALGATHVGGLRRTIGAPLTSEGS